jgi:hypothetical protein
MRNGLYFYCSERGGVNRHVFATNPEMGCRSGIGVLRVYQVRCSGLLTLTTASHTLLNAQPTPSPALN